ncbi:MAG: 3-oxoacyl-[acyl-carrier-protein] reductase [Candidatus Omnitrophota bacterium]|nr:3-oxoacyl-[acyl-carrier-protein] reductase [Candidatus Omnitrophota bacterium]
MDDLKEKTVIITGGSRGIGRACCLAFAKAGANIVFTYNKSKKEAEELTGEINKLGVNCLSIQTDVRDYNQCRSVVEKALERFKELDILVNNAGITKDKALLMMTLDDWKDVVETNLGGTFNMTRAAITTLLKQKKGCIINMSSVSGIVGLARQTNYSASKAGIIGFSKALAKEVAAYNIRVNAVCPGFINTEIVASLHENIKKEILNTIPVKRLGEVDEVANLCVFLASDKANYITGEVIKIDGGLAI